MRPRFLAADDGEMEIERNGTFDVVTVGEALVDLVAPDALDLVHASSFVRAAGGAPANVAVAAARLGACSALVGAVGRDAFGSFLRLTLAENRVDVSWLLETDARTTLALVAKNAGGIPDFVFYRGADAVLRAEDIPVDLIARAAYVHVSSMAVLSEPSRSATLRAIALAHEAGALVSVDPNLRPSSWPSIDAARAAITPLMEAADVLKVNDDEALLLTESGDLTTAIQQLARPDRLTVITAGAEGCMFRWQGEAGRASAPTVEVIETTGAGDAFVGALLAELSRRGPGRESFSALSSEHIEEILTVACAAGALACTRVGAMAALPTRPEVERLLHTG